MFVLLGSLVIVFLIQIIIKDFFAVQRPIRYKPTSREERQAALRAEEDAIYRDMRLRQQRINYR